MSLYNIISAPVGARCYMVFVGLNRLYIEAMKNLVADYLEASAVSCGAPFGEAVRMISIL